MMHWNGLWGVPFVGFGLLWVIALLVTLYVIYDVLVRQEEMQVFEKLVWVLVVVAFNLIGVLVYAYVVWYRELRLFDEVGGIGRLSRLERLQELRASGALTEEEFQREKEKLLETE